MAVLAAENVSYTYQSKYQKVQALKNVSCTFEAGKFYAIIGQSGSGKTTLMDILAGKLVPDRGSVQIGQTVRIGYFSQHSEFPDSEQRVLEYIRDVSDHIETNDGTRITAAQMLERFLFPSELQWVPVNKLSGGEKRRLYLLRVLMGAPNVLLLDEPTNDLDIRTLTILEDYLDHFQGIVIAVSHDRYFLDRVVRRIFAFEGDGAVKQYEGGYTDYQAALEERGQGQEESTAAKAGAEDQSQPNRKNWKEGQPRETKLKFTYKEQREWETIEETIAALEEEVAELEGEILQAASDYSRLNRLMQEKEEKEAQLEEKMERWMYLNELAEQIGAQ